jgi:hypothetical protein
MPLVLHFMFGVFMGYMFGIAGLAFIIGLYYVGPWIHRKINARRTAKWELFEQALHAQIRKTTASLPRDIT